MQSSIVALVAFTMLLAYVQCIDPKKPVAEYEITESLLGGGRHYDIKNETNGEAKFSTRNELFRVGKKLFLLKNGKELYVAKHDIFNSMSTWTITDAVTHKELGLIKHEVKFFGSEIEARGSFGTYRIFGEFANHKFDIMKDGQKVAKIEKERRHAHETYGLSVYGTADQGLMVLFTLMVDEIRHR